jgi:iron complex outermembrane receptor protein
VLTQDQVNSNVLGPGIAGDRIPYVPKITGGVSVQYSYPLAPSMNAMMRVDESYVGSSFSKFNNSQGYYEKLPAYSLTNARIGVEAPDGNWGAYLYANNLFDRVAIVSATASAISRGQNIVASARPRTVGLNFRKRLDF